MSNLTFRHGLIAGSTAILAFILMCQFILWYIALFVIVVWTPICIKYCQDLLKIDYVLVLYFIFVAIQSIHMTEHVAQMVQIHLLGRSFANSHGLFGDALDNEWLHFSFDSLWIPGWTIYLIYKRRCIWMIAMFPLVLLHCAEHIVIMDYYLRTGISGNAGIMAIGGLIGSPLSRPDLHLLYNAIEETCMVLGFRKAIE